MTDDFKPSLPKVPFIAADIVLVIIACIIAFSGDGRPEGFEAFLCAACGVVGALIAIFPFYADFKAMARLQEFSQGQDFEQRYQQLESAMIGLRDHVEHIGGSTGDTERVEQKVHETLQMLDSRVRFLEEGRSELEAKVEIGNKRGETATGSKNKLQKKIEEAIERLNEEDERIRHLENALIILEEKLTQSGAGELKAEGVERRKLPQELDMEDFRVELTRMQEELERRKKDASSQDSYSEFSEKQPTSEHVDQVSDFKETIVEFEPAEAQDNETIDVAEPVAEFESTTSDSNSTVADDLNQERVETGTDAEEIVDDFAMVAEGDDAFPQQKEPVSDPAIPVEQAELLVDIPPQKRRSKKPTKTTSTLVAQVLIGIGNKPYVRGEGPGLSKEKGVPMEFLEIGKWQWTAPDANDPITCYIYKNDEVVAEGEPIVLEPGQRRAVSPKFPA